MRLNFLSVIHRILFLRVLWAALLLSVIVGGAVFLFEWRQLGIQARDLAQMSVEVLRIEAPHILKRSITDPSTQQEVADNFIRQPPRSDMGRFVLLVLYDAAMQEKVKAIDPALPDAQRLIAALARVDSTPISANIVLGPMLDDSRVPYVPFMLTITGDRGETFGYLKGVFSPSPTVASRLLRTALQASVWAAALVLMTTFVIYPVVRGLIVKLEKLAGHLFDANIDMMKVIGSAIAKRDSDTDAHNYRVVIYSVRLAEAVGVDAKDIESLMKGAFLHDVGKIGIPDAILHKAGALTQAEREIMQSHVMYGLDIVGNAAWLADALHVVGCHHEKFDGSGYPNCLVGAEIPLSARIFAIADVFDALTSVRPYKKAFSLEESLAIMRQAAGQHFDPELIAIFEQLAPEVFATVTGHADELPHLLESVVKPYFDDYRKAVT
jgi:HD-GYP domain-containing protein (c-di-GMP phosphodiesterase class II)